jgi:hypothetical protein
VHLFFMGKKNTTVMKIGSTSIENRLPILGTAQVLRLIQHPECWARALSPFWILIWTLGVVGCATGPTQLAVNYVPPSSAPSSALENIHIHVEELVDVRVGKTEKLIGEAKTGMFNISTPITIESTVASLCSSELRKALTAAGYKVIDEVQSADLVLRGRINVFWVQEYVTGYSLEHSEAEIELDLGLFSPTGQDPLWYDVKRSFVKSGQKIDATVVNEELMNEAFQGVIHDLLGDENLVAAIEAY